MKNKKVLYILIAAFVMAVCCGVAFSIGVHVGKGSLSEVSYSIDEVATELGMIKTRLDSIDEVTTKLGMIENKLDSIEWSLSSIADEVGNVWRYR